MPDIMDIPESPVKGDDDIVELPPRKDKEGFSKIEDENPKTWINENLWKVFLFKLFAYSAPVIAGSVIIIEDTVTGFSFGKFLWGISMIVIPLFSSASDAQANNRRNQERIKAEEKREMEEKQHQAKMEEMDTVNDNLRMQLDTKIKENYNAIF